jgi:hypothetical protein
MLKTPLNEWTLKALQLETALMALQEIELPGEMGSLQQGAEQKLQALVDAWQKRRPAPEARKWKMEEKEGGTPQDTELGEVVQGLQDEKQEWTVHRATSDKGEVVETIIAGSEAWMVAAGEYYFGQWDEEAKVLEVGRDDETGEPGTGLVLTLTGELVFESDDEE